MAQVIGSQGRVVVDKEATYGQLNGNTQQGWIIPFTSCSVSKEQNLIESNTIYASRNPREPGLGQINVTGDLAVELNPLSHGRLIYFALGGYSVTAQDPDSTPSSGDEYYEHTFTVGNTLPSFILESKFSDGINFTKYYQYLGCKVNQWSLTARPDSFIESTFSIIGSNKVTSDTEYDDPDDVGHSPFTDYDAAIYIGGNHVGIVTEQSININNDQVGNSFTVGGGATRAFLPEGMVKVDGSVTVQFTDSATSYIDLAENSTNTSLKLTLTNGNGDGTSGNEYMEILFPEIKLQPPREEITGPQGVFLTFNFIAFDTGNDSAVQVTIKNQVADYSISGS